MTIAQLVDQVYLKITGGVPSDDVNVERADIRNFAPAAIGYAADKHIKVQLNEAVQDWREYGIGREGIGQDLLLGYTLEVSRDTTRDLDYVTLPSRILYLPGDRGFRYAYIPGGEFNVSFRRAGSAVELRNMPDITGVVWMWVEEDKVYFKGLGFPKPEEILVRAALDYSSIDDDTDIPMTRQMEYDAVLILTEYFTEQRQMPEDVTNTGVDEKV